MWRLSLRYSILIKPNEETMKLTSTKLKICFLFTTRCDPRRPKKFKDDELKAFLDKNCYQRDEKLTEFLGVTQAGI